jgi:hypothetical protein
VVLFSELQCPAQTQGAQGTRRLNHQNDWLDPGPGAQRYSKQQTVREAVASA